MPPMRTNRGNTLEARTAPVFCWFARHPWVLVAVSGVAIATRAGTQVRAANVAQAKLSARANIQNELHEAARWGDAESAARAINKGAYPNGDWDTPPLLHAVEWNDIDVARLLLARGADPNGMDRRGTFSPILSAVTSPHIPENRRAAWIKLLRQSGGRADREDGANALRYAVRTDRADAAMALMAAGASPNTRMVTGETALTHAVHSHFDRTALALAAYGARQ